MNIKDMPQRKIWKDGADGYDRYSIHIESGETVNVRPAKDTGLFGSEERVITAVDETEFVKGDANLNGIVDAVDASLILTHYAQISAGKNGIIKNEALKYCDFNEDGVVDGRDASAVLSEYAQKSVES